MAIRHWSLLRVVSRSKEVAARLCERCGPTVSHHLKKLTDAGLLDRERRGKWAYFSLNRDAAERLAAVADLKERAAHDDDSERAAGAGAPPLCGVGPRRGRGDLRTRVRERIVLL
ncbi:MAG: ArsR/SmtB family transcription factor [Verrucomicrobiota bacterium]